MITVKKCTSNITKCLYTNTSLKSTNLKVMKITLDSSSHIFYVSLKILVDHFALFEKKINLNIMDEHKNCTKISFVGNDDFKTLLEIIANGKLKFMCFLY